MNRVQFARKKIWPILFVLFGCVEPFEPPYSDREIHFLVIDGFLDSGNKTATVKLSYAVPLNATSTASPARNATVTVEKEGGQVISLAETSAGVYTASSNLIENGKAYRLKVSINAREYASDEVILKASPPLDDITWKTDELGLSIYVDSHDAAERTKYYQWVYKETWEYAVSRYSTFKWSNRKIVGLKADEMVNICYSNNTSTRVLIRTTTTNTRDVVNDFRLAFVPAGSSKLWRMYSIEVEQRAIDEQAYNYWLNVQRTTEDLGNLFDPLPSEVKGNVYNVTDEQEKVLGYFSGGEVQRKRLFIRPNELPVNFVSRPELCPDIFISPERLFQEYPNEEVYLIADVPGGFTTAAPLCIDCRTGGGTNKRPDFWPAD